MLKRKLQNSLARSDAKRIAQEANRLQILFSGEERIPETVRTAIDYVQSLVIWRKFDGKVPPVVLKSTIYALFTDHTKIDSEINELRCQGHIVVTKLDSGTYGLIEKDVYLSRVNKLAEEGNIDLDTAKRFILFCTRDELNVEVNPRLLTKTLNEADVTTMVREGFLTSEVTGMYYLTIPNASIFLRALNDGRKDMKNIIKRSMFKEILMSELLKKKSKKAGVLGMTYHSLDFIGDQCVKLVPTTSGPILRYCDDD